MTNIVSTLTVDHTGVYADHVAREVTTTIIRAGTVVGRLCRTNSGRVCVTFGAYRAWVPESHLVPVV
jgi:hypothetical protein